MQVKSGYNSGFDLIKAVLALCIVGIHTILSAHVHGNWVEFILAPIFRLAVPIFFIFSGYFFFHKQSKIDYKERKLVWIQSVLRYLKLYLFWLIVLLPITVVYRDYFARGFTDGVGKFINALFFGSTFPASWYISALAISVSIVFLLSYFISDGGLIIIAICTNIICTLVSNYGNTVIGDSILRLVERLPFNVIPSESFLVAITWIVIGKLFAENRIPKSSVNKDRIYLILSIVGLYIEQLVTMHFNTKVVNDGYFMQIPVCIFLFILILNFKWETKQKSYFLRDFSTIVYCMHICLLLVIKFALKVAGINYHSMPIAIFLWIIVVIAGVLLTKVIIFLEKKPGWTWLQYSH